ncbi:hypothetical protein N9948_01655 [bacterium]|nr:hypothetical protein [bacterium]
MTRRQRFIELVKVYAQASAGKTYLTDRGKPICIGALEITSTVAMSYDVPAKLLSNENIILSREAIQFCDWNFSCLSKEHEPDWAQKFFKMRSKRNG